MKALVRKHPQTAANDNETGQVTQKKSPVLITTAHGLDSASTFLASQEMAWESIAALANRLLALDEKPGVTIGMTPCLGMTTCAGSLGRK